MGGEVSEEGGWDGGEVSEEGGWDGGGGRVGWG